MKCWDNWVKINTQIRLTEEPYPRSQIKCNECEQVWDDDGDELCVCPEDLEEESDE